MDRIRLAIFIAVVGCISSCSTEDQKEPSDKLVFMDEEGNRISMSDLEGATGEYRWEIRGDQIIPEEANRLHQEGRQHGAKGEYDLAIEKLKRANELAPEWAYPVYDLAFTYLLRRDYENALRYYELTDSLEPKGFFTAKTACWSLRKEKEGEFEPGLYLAYVQIEWMPTEAEQLQTAKAILNKYPTYSPAWKTVALIMKDNKEKLAAIEHGLSSDPDAETKGVLLINQASIKSAMGQKETAKQILGELIIDKESTLGNVEIAKYTLRTIVTE